MSERIKAKVGGVEVELAAPASLAMRYDVVIASERNRQRAMAAALAVCWQSGGGRPTVKYDYDVMRFGGLVIDELSKRGVPMRDILAAGGLAFGLCADGLFSEHEVAEAVGNSEAGESPAQ
jgi:hypothetical protein